MLLYGIFPWLPREKGQTNSLLLLIPPETLLAPPSGGQDALCGTSGGTSPPEAWVGSCQLSACAEGLGGAPWW